MMRRASRRAPRLPTRRHIVELGREVARALRNLREARGLATLATVILSLTLAVVGVVVTIALHAGRIATAATPPDQINVYLAKPVAGAERDATLAAIERVEGVESARYVGPEDALEELANGMPEVREWIAALGENPLPATVVVTVRSAADLGRAEGASPAATLATVAGVTGVQAAGEAVARVVPVLRSIRWAAGGVASALVVAMLFAIVATFRLTLEPRRDEIEILRLTGATERWVRAPLWIEGALLGAVAGLVSAVLALACGARLGPLEVPALVTGHTGALVLDVVPSGVCVGLAALGPLLGAAGAAVATRWGLGRAE